MTLDDLPVWAQQLIATARVARLGLLDERDLPRVLPITYAVWDAALWTAIDRKPKTAPEPARVRRLRRRPEAALLVDVYDDDWTRLAWVEVRGTMSVLDADRSREPLEALAAKYEQYRAERPPGPLLRLSPERHACWRYR